MPTSLDEQDRLDKGTQYDSGASGWNTNIGGLGRPPSSRSAIPDSLPVPGRFSRKKQNKGIDADDLRNTENNSLLGDGQKSAKLAKEGGSAADKVFTSPKVMDALAQQTPIGRAAKFTGFFKKKRGKAAAGTGIGGIIIFVIMGFFAPGLFFQHLKESAIGKGNSFARIGDTQSEKRKVKGQIKNLVEATSENARVAESAAYLEQFGAEAEKAGYAILRDADGAVTGIAKAGDEGKVLIDLSKGKSVTAINREVGKFIETDAGREFITSINEVNPAVASEWRGLAATKNFLERLKVGFANLFDRKPKTPDEPPGDITQDGLANATEADSASIAAEQDAAQAAKDANAPKDAVAEDVVSSETKDAAKKADEAFKAAPSTTGAALDGGADAASGAYVASDGGGALGATVKATTESTGGIVAAADETTVGVLTALKGQIGSFLASDALSGAFSALNAVAIPQAACKLKGTINYISQVKNVFLALELAKFAVRILVVSDQQRAGLVKGEALNLAGTYMKGSTASGGMRHMMGDTSARVSPQNLGKYGTGRSPTGLLATLYDFANSFPGVSPKSCKFVNNGWVTVGAVVLGSLFAVFGGSESGATEANGALGIALQIGSSLAFAIATPILIRTVTHQVMTGVKDSLQIGDAFASGSGSLLTSTAGAHAMQPVTQPQLAYMQMETSAYEQVAMRKTSLWDRYINPHTDKSLFSRLALAMPFTPQAATSKASRYIASSVATLSNPIVSIVGSFSKGGSAYADAIGSDQCTDKHIQDLQLVTDPFCNPLVANVPNLDIADNEDMLRQNNQIDAQGKPLKGSDFEKYVNDCLTGRTSLAYSADVSKDGESSPEGDDACVSTSKDTALPIDHPVTIYAMRDIGKPNLWDKITGSTRAYAAVGDTNITPTAKMRYALQQGYLVDSANSAQELSNNFTGDSSTTTTTPSATVATGPATPIVIDPANDTSNIPCAGGKDAGNDAGYLEGVTHKIHLCNINTFVMNSQVSKQFSDMYDAAKAVGLDFIAPRESGGFRNMAEQVNIYLSHCASDPKKPIPTPGPYPHLPRSANTSCSGGAPPGYSNHQMGLAADIGCNGTLIPQVYTSASSNPCFQWLVAHAGAYGFFEFGHGNNRGGDGYEAWHWSVDGG